MDRRAGVGMMNSSPAKTGTGAGGNGAAGVKDGAVAAGWPRWAMYARISSLRTRPPSPEPLISERSIACSWASLRANGDTFSGSVALCAMRRPLPFPLPLPGATPLVVGAATADVLALVGVAELAVVAAGVAAVVAVAVLVVSISAISAPTFTVSFSLTRIFASLPENGDGISSVILSVMISTSGSSFFTVSPSFLSQRPTVPSLTDSPNCGIVILVGIPALLIS